jgi:outer membrane protein OmpA-like peptidoglycan-associated protein
MKAKRTALLGILVCLIAAAASAQIATSSTGDIGLFTIPTADTPRAGQLTLGVYGWKEQLVAGDLAFEDVSFRNRLYSHWAGEGSLGLGLTDNWEVWVSGGADRFESRGGWRGGALNSVQFFSRFRADEPRKLVVGTKYRIYSEADSDFRLGLWLAAHVPMGQATMHVDQVDADVDRVKSRRTDWEWGVAGTKGIVTGMVSYQLSGRHDQDIRVSNLLRVGVGVDLPVMPILHVIAELDRNIYDGGDLPAEPYSLLTTGARFYVGRTGWSVSGAINANLDMLFKHGFSPAPIGGLIGVSYAAWPPLPPPPVVIPAPAPSAPIVIEEKTETTVTTPPPAPPPAAPKQTRDEIQFDAGSARLTNIAKAILDGIALRMKNDLNSTAVVTGYSDNAGAEPANVAISAKRADAAKEYLVTRHGIDPNRISTVSKGSAEPAYDNATAEGRAKNRRAVIVVTLVSGS